MIEVGIIGCGKIAQTRHIPEYMANPHTEVFGFFDVNRERAASLPGNTAVLPMKATSRCWMILKSMR